jgi:hypothetical protein
MQNLVNTTVIHGTHRTQDLIPAFLDALRVVWPEAYEGYMAAPFPPIPAYVMDEGDDSSWWDSEDAAYLLETLIDLLGESAPEV